MNVLLNILVSFKMPFHNCANKAIPSEISMSGDYLRLEDNKGWKICPGARHLTKKFPPGPRFDPCLNICSGFAGGGGGMVTLETD